MHPDSMQMIPVISSSSTPEGSFQDGHNDAWLLPQLLMQAGTNVNRLGQILNHVDEENKDSNVNADSVDITTATGDTRCCCSS